MALGDEAARGDHGAIRVRLIAVELREVVARPRRARSSRRSGWPTRTPSSVVSEHSAAVAGDVTSHWISGPPIGLCAPAFVMLSLDTPPPIASVAFFCARSASARPPT